MRQSGWSRSLLCAVARAVALLVTVPTLALGVAVELSSGASATPTPVAARTNSYGGGANLAADPTGGYWTVSWAGAVAPHGSAPALGSPAESGLRLTKPIIGMAATPDGGGYWLVASDGGIFNYGDATFYGSTGAMHLNQPIVGMAPTPDGDGYWLVASDGGIFSYGDATFYGSTGSIHLNKAIVGMASTTDGRGYWLVASDGGIFSYGDAAFHGSTGAIRLNQPIIGMAPTADGAGYWLVASDGGVFTFGDAGYYGSTAGSGVTALGIVIDPPVPGYAVVSEEGNETSFGPSAPNGNVQPTPPDGSGRSGTTTATRPPATTTTRPSRVTTTTGAPSGPSTTTPPSTPAPPASGLQQGAYVGAADPSGLAAFAQQTGTRPTVATDYLPSNDGWAGMDGAGGSLNWLTGAWKGTGYTLSLGVPIIPDSSSGAPVGTLALGASGAYNLYFVTLAQTLISGGEANAYLRLGFEFDGAWMAWAATTPSTEASFAAYFQQIVTAMRAVPGENFRFVWNPDAAAFTQSGYSVAAAYPGSAYVDVIGLDAYDQSWASPLTPSNAWSSTTLPALTAARQFASTQGKPLALTEWGAIIRSDGHGLGDDPYYINQMVSWMKSGSNNVTYETYFDYNPSGLDSQLTGGLFPNSLVAFSADLG